MESIEQCRVGVSDGTCLRRNGGSSWQSRNGVALAHKALSARLNLEFLLQVVEQLAEGPLVCVAPAHVTLDLGLRRGG